MAAIEHLTITLPATMAAKVRDWVAVGDFPDIDTAVLEALMGLDAEQSAADAATEAEFVRRVVIPAIERYDADPSRGLTADQVRDHLAKSRKAREQARC